MLPQVLLPAVPQDYWIGLSYSSGAWNWHNTTTVLGSSIVPSNASPYAHWAQAANTTSGAGTTATCVMAQLTSAYGLYTGDGTTAQMTAAYFQTSATNKTNGWLPVVCSGLKDYLCSGSAAALYPCPPAPPAAPPPPPLPSSSNLCEQGAAGEGRGSLCGGPCAGGPMCVCSKR